ncbi:hypothetical protein E4U54_007916 [Claviceps lovelessii]|nr:hypothetical protein E4U54_007916 [Claviceps lovelessii]
MACRIFDKMLQSHKSSTTVSPEMCNEELRDLHGSDERNSNHPLRFSTTAIFGEDEMAKDMVNHERTMSVGYMLKHYRRAMFWVAFLAAPIFIEGYATALLSSFFSYGPFIKKFGHQESGQIEYTISISTPWETGITIASACGQLIGLWMAPFVTYVIGYRLCRNAGLVIASFSTLLLLWSSDARNPLALFLVSQLFLGIPWGLFQAIILPYISDITPLRLRAPASAVISMFWLAGQFLTAVVLREARQFRNSAWRLATPILVQSTLLIPIMCIPCRPPESPLYLAQEDSDDEAKQTLRYLHRYPTFCPDTALAALKAVDVHEEETSNRPGLLSCFRGVNLRRTEIAVMVSVTQQCVGMPLITYPLQLLQKDGLSSERALPITVGLLALFFMSTFCSMPAMRFIGRRTLWLAGLSIETASLVALGGLAWYAEHGPKNISTITGYLTVILAMAYHLTTGPVCYAIVAETPATRLKTETNTLARAAYILLSLVNVYLVPQLLQIGPAGWNIGLRAAFVWAGTATGCLVWAWFRLPEMKDRSPAEIDVLFEHNVAARQWGDASF